MLDLINLKKYIYDLEHYEGFKTLEKYKNKFYCYKGIIIDYKFDDIDETSEKKQGFLSDPRDDTFEPFLNTGYIRKLGEGSRAKYDYMPDVLLVEYEKDIEKYKDDIIKYIDKIAELKQLY